VVDGDGSAAKGAVEEGSTTKTTFGDSGNIGGIIGIIGGVLAALILAGAGTAGFVYYRKRNNQQQERERRLQSIPASQLPIAEVHGCIELGAVTVGNAAANSGTLCPEELEITMAATAENVSSPVASLPSLYAVLQDLHMTAWNSKLVVIGIHTTEMLLWMEADDLKAIGMHTFQRDRVMRKIGQLKTVLDGNSANGGISDILDVSGEKGGEVKRNWRRRFSVQSSREFFENMDSGMTQFTAPQAFGGEDEVWNPTVAAAHATTAAAMSPGGFKNPALGKSKQTKRKNEAKQGMMSHMAPPPPRKPRHKKNKSSFTAHVVPGTGQTFYSPVGGGDSVWTLPPDAEVLSPPSPADHLRNK
jgi:hypothetical protein